MPDRNADRHRYSADSGHWHDAEGLLAFWLDPESRTAHSRSHDGDSLGHTHDGWGPSRSHA
jgi:hypothetical protein